MTTDIIAQVGQDTVRALRQVREHSKNPLVICGSFEISRHLLSFDPERPIRLTSVGHIIALVDAMIDAEDNCEAVDALFLLLRIWKGLNV